MGKGRLAVDGGEPVIKGELPSWPWFDEETIKAAMEPLRTGALNIGPGDEVITTPYSFIATSFCVLQAGAIPVFADVRREDHCIDPDEIRKKITKRTKAIIPVHLYGNVCEMDEIMSIAEEHGLWVIEDCAEAHGALYKGKKVGSIGHIGAFSFCQNKTFTTGGEGGMVITDDEEIA